MAIGRDFPTPNLTPSTAITEGVTQSSLQRYIRRLGSLAQDPTQNVSSIDKSQFRTNFVGALPDTETLLGESPSVTMRKGAGGFFEKVTTPADPTRLNEKQLLEQFLPYTEARLATIQNQRTRGGRASTIFAGARQ